MFPSIPEKRYYKIGEVSRMFSLEPHVLRFWESEFSIIRPKKDSGNQRLYRRKDLESISRVKKLLYEEKFTIAGAREKLKEAEQEIAHTSSPQDNRELKESLLLVKKGLEEIRVILS